MRFARLLVFKSSTAHSTWLNLDLFPYLFYLLKHLKLQVNLDNEDPSLGACLDQTIFSVREEWESSKHP